MSTLLSDEPDRLYPVSDAAKARRAPGFVRRLAAVALVLLAAYPFSFLLQSPAGAIREALAAAAAEARDLPWNRSPAEVEAAIARHFAGTAAHVQVDARRFPALVTVTLDRLNRDTCLEARKVARRMEGSVVVMLEGYGSAADCGQENRMVWRIMP